MVICKWHIHLPSPTQKFIDNLKGIGYTEDEIDVLYGGNENDKSGSYAIVTPRDRASADLYGLVVRRIIGESDGGNVENYRSISQQSELPGRGVQSGISNRGRGIENTQADSEESAFSMPENKIRRSVPIDDSLDKSYNEDTHYGENLRNTPNFLKPTTEREWQFFCRSFANQTNGMKQNEYRIASVFTADNHYIIEADGYMSGRIVSKSSISDYNEKEKFFDDYSSSKIFDGSNDRNGNRQGNYGDDSNPLENKETDTFNVELDEFIRKHPEWFSNKRQTYWDSIRRIIKNKNATQADSEESAFSMPENKIRRSVPIDENSQVSKRGNKRT